MNHNLEKIAEPNNRNRYRCTTCQQQWMGKPRSTCPGLPIHDEVPDGMILFNDLFSRGLKLVEGQKRVALYDKQWQAPLYRVAECVPHNISLTFDEGKYKFLQTEAGFDIYRVNGLKVSVLYANTYLRLDGNARCDHGLYQWKEALYDAAMAFAVKLVSRDKEEAGEMISRALAHRFFLGWQRIVKEIAPPEVEELARKVWASAQTDIGLLHNADLYSEAHKHTRTDLLKYNACRLYAANTQRLDDVAHWRERLAPAVPNKALNKTLDKLPVAVSYRQITRLSTIQLTEPVTDRLHLIFILCASDHHNWGLHERAVVSATPQMVQQAAAVFNRNLTSRSKTVVIGDVARSILDYDQPYGGDLLGLALRSYAWHGEMPLNVPTIHSDHALDAATPLVTPPGVDLAALEEKGVTLLKTAGDCYHEHDVMQHCIHTYASKAQAGLCYLFHVEYEAPGADRRVLATVEVSPAGEVVQAKGPKNSNNAACHYGIGVLKEAFKAMAKESR